LVASWENSTAMEVFLQRAAVASGYNLGAGNWTAFASSHWDTSPMKGAGLSAALGQLLSLGLAEEPATSLAPAAAGAPTTSAGPTDAARRAAENGTIPAPRRGFAGTWELLAAIGGSLLIACIALVLVLTGKARACRCCGGAKACGNAGACAAGDGRERARAAPARALAAGDDAELGRCPDMEVSGDAVESHLPRLGLHGRTRSEAIAGSAALDCEGMFRKPPLAAAPDVPQAKWDLEPRVVEAAPRAESGCRDELGSDVPAALHSTTQAHFADPPPASSEGGGSPAGASPEAAVGFRESSTGTPSSGSRTARKVSASDTFRSEGSAAFSEEGSSRPSSRDFECLSTGTVSEYGEYDTVGFIKI